MFCYKENIVNIKTYL